MSVGEVIFKAGEMYDGDMWDDSALIRDYEKAYEASRRELIRRRKSGRAKKEWSMGEPCRIFYLQDSEEYEGIIVKISARSAVVRLHGFNEEVEVPVSDLEPSRGQDHVDQQIAAAAQEEEEEEEPFTGELKQGAQCRARWSLDDVVYEGNILWLEKNKVRVQFIGYNNEDTVDAKEVFASKGEEWRDQQLLDAEYDFTSERIEDIDTDIHKLIDEHPDVFLQSLQASSDLPDLSSLAIQPHIKQEKKKEKAKKEKSKSKSDKKKKSDNSFSQVSFPHVSECDLSAYLPPLESNLPKPTQPSLSFQQSSLPLPQSSLPLPQSSLPLPQSSFSLPQSSLPLPHSSLPLPQSSLPLPQSSLPGHGDSSAPVHPPPAEGRGMGAFPQMLAPPPPPSGQHLQSSLDNEVLHSMLISWYMAGYHTGFYQAHSQTSGQTPGHASGHAWDQTYPSQSSQSHPTASSHTKKKKKKKDN